MPRNLNICPACGADHQTELRRAARQYSYGEHDLQLLTVHCACGVSFRNGAVVLQARAQRNERFFQAVQAARLGHYQDGTVAGDPDREPWDWSERIHTLADQLLQARANTSETLVQIAAVALGMWAQIEGAGEPLVTPDPPRRMSEGRTGDTVTRVGTADVHVYIGDPTAPSSMRELGNAAAMIPMPRNETMRYVHGDWNLEEVDDLAATITPEQLEEARRVSRNAWIATWKASCFTQRSRCVSRRNPPRPLPSVH